jgi:Icc-related predicted phosphoesterase
MNLWRRSSHKPAVKKRGYRIYYATDLHGSDVCFRKFLAAGRVFDADAVIMGGDMTGKAIAAIRVVGRDRYESEFLGEKVQVDSEGLEHLKKRITFNGFYPWVAEDAEIQRAEQDEGYVGELFETFMAEQARRWAQLAADRLDDHRRCFISPGNDDLYVVDEVLAGAERIEFPDKRVVEVGPLHMVSVGDSNVTPWRTPREMSEADLLTELEDLIKPYADGRPLLFNFHVPPHESGLDTVNALDPSYRPVVEHGMIAQTSAGSTAVRTVIERYEPVAALHGHIHEGRGLYRQGPSRCLNPGSDYSAGILQGLVIDFADDGSYMHHTFTAG